MNNKLTKNIKLLQIASTHNGITYGCGTEVDVLSVTSYGIATVEVTDTGVIFEVDKTDLGRSYE